MLLVLDGHSSHISFEDRELAIENGVHMLKLPPHLTHLLQPLDVGVFKPMKANWYSAVADFTRRERRGLTKRDFPEVLSTVWKKYNPQTAKGGFKGCIVSTITVRVQNFKEEKKYTTKQSIKRHI